MRNFYSAAAGFLIASSVLNGLAGTIQGKSSSYPLVAATLSVACALLSVGEAVAERKEGDRK